MHFILKLKHWQVFLILSAAAIFSNFTWEKQDNLNLVVNSFGIVLYFLWYFIIGLELTEHLPPRVELSRTMFIINAFVLMISMAIIIGVFGGHFSSNGLLGFAWIAYIMYAMFQFMFYPSKVLKSVELGTEASLGQYIRYFFLIFFWPVGIWWIQPKLNKIESENDNQ